MLHMYCAELWSKREREREKERVESQQSSKVTSDTDQIFELLQQRCTHFSEIYEPTGGTRWRSWLRHCATSRKVVGSIPDGVNQIFHWHPSGLTMVLGLTLPLIEMSTRNISWGVKATGAWGWQPYYHHEPIVLKYGSLNLLEPSGPVQDCFTLYTVRYTEDTRLSRRSICLLFVLLWHKAVTLL